MLAAVACTPLASVAQAAFPIVWSGSWSSPGGRIDVVAHIIGQKLSEKYGQPVIVDNKPGAGGSIGHGRSRSCGS